MKNYKFLLKELRSCESWLTGKTSELAKMNREHVFAGDTEEGLKAELKFKEDIRELRQEIEKETTKEKDLEKEISVAIADTKQKFYDEKSGLYLIEQVATSQGIDAEELSRKMDIYAKACTTKELLDDGSRFSKCILARQRINGLINDKLQSEVSELLDSKQGLTLEALQHLDLWYHEYTIAKKNIGVGASDSYENPETFRAFGTNELEKEALNI